MKKALFFCIVCILVLPASGFAAELAAEEPTAIDIYLEKVDKKFDRGVNNFVIGWAEIIRQPIVYSQNEEKKNPALKAAQGLGAGFLIGPADILGGFFNAATALLPQFEIPLPQGGIQTSQITGGDAEKKLVKIRPQEPIL